MSIELNSLSYVAKRSKLTRQQINGFWAAWFGWMLDGMDSVIYALVLAPALFELLPKSGIQGTPGNVALAGSALFALFLVGWGFSFIWGPIADKFGRAKALMVTILVYSVFTFLSAFSQNIWELALFRFLSGIGIGGEWSMAGTYVSEAWPEDRRKMGAGYLQTGYYAGFFVAAALNFTVGAHFGWRPMFMFGLVPALVSFWVLFGVKEPERWKKVAKQAQKQRPLAAIFGPAYRKRTIVNSILLTVAIIGLWAGSVYEPTALIVLSKKAGMTAVEAAHMSSYGTGLLSIGTILGCMLLPLIAEKIGRKKTLGLYFAIMAVTIILSFGWAFYLPHGLAPFLIVLFFLGFGGGNFAMFSLWLPEQYHTDVRATAFAFCTSVGRFIGAIVTFVIGALVKGMGTLGTPVALTSIAFVIGLLIIPLALETKGAELPE
ncbi:MFS transporter [Fodinisporobacter ferrooxydans]|uniref:MFS transporter n=1 Tax=Fodinisporobacter ferrooxydans TaxID=2901836 RepID=A0ABY4CGR2_9BACL|nr:MFS transporter [Alicyclobacillaceae bacterium MYW30-H2]